MRPGRVSTRLVIKWSRDHMANYKVPRTVRFLDEFPMNAGGKVMKNVLRELAARDAS